MSQTPQEILAELRKRELLSEEALAGVADLTDGKVILQRLVRDGHLSEFQAKAVWQGAAASLLIGGAYVIVDRLGSGGMGVVYKARHRMMNRIVAVKVLSAALSHNEAMKKRFFREVQAAARLNHPNIVTAYDAGEHAHRLFLVMEFVDGVDLSTLIDKRGPIGIDQAVNIVLQSAAALDYAHAQGVIHRDVKPANLLLRRDGVVKVLDMGLAVLIDAESQAEHSLTMSGRMMGTVEYMPPEQAENPKLADHRADIYALGCTLYRIVTGQLPYTGETAFSLALAHRDRPIPNIGDTLPGAAEALQHVFARMVAKQRDDRYPSMRHVIEALQQALPSAARTPLHLDSRTIGGSRSDPEGMTLPGAERTPPSFESTMPTMPAPASSARQRSSPSLPQLPELPGRRSKKKPWAAIVGVGMAIVIGMLVMVLISSMFKSSDATPDANATVAQITSPIKPEPAATPIVSESPASQLVADLTPAGGDPPGGETVVTAPPAPSAESPKLVKLDPPTEPTRIQPAEPAPTAPLTPTPPAAPAPPPHPELVIPDGAVVLTPASGLVDLMPFIDPRADAIDARWVITPRGLVAQAGPGGDNRRPRLVLPVRVLDDYELQAEFHQVFGHTTGLILPLAPSAAVHLVIDTAAANLRLELKDQDAVDQSIPADIKLDGPLSMFVQVSHEADKVSVNVALNDHAVLHWSGPPMGLRLEPNLMLTAPDAPGLTSMATDTSFEHVRFRVIHGTAAQLRAEPVDRTANKDGANDAPPPRPNDNGPPGEGPPNRPQRPGLGEREGRFDRPRLLERPGSRPNDR
ncbi:MAG: protein kinase [Planctomycetes bacterium]|nr:protein kinase [Planctomycetota bacterium]